MWLLADVGGEIFEINGATCASLSVKYQRMHRKRTQNSQNNLVLLKHTREATQQEGYGSHMAGVLLLVDASSRCLCVRVLEVQRDFC